MQNYSNDERLALLLNLIGDSATEVALKSVAAPRAAVIKRLITEFKADPPSPDEIQLVLQDFERYFQFAMSQLKVSDDKKKNGESNSKVDSPLAPQITIFERVESTYDVVADLCKLDPYQIATALADDQPKTIALVLRQLESDISGRALEFFPETIRVESFIELGNPTTIPQPIVQKVMRTIFEKANAIRQRRVDPEMLDKLVEMMRALPKETRRSMMTNLKDKTPEFAEQIQAKLYRFKDLLRLNDRSIQSVLAKIQSEQLVMSLTRADQEISTRILSNMSKRARQSIEEEIGFNERATEEEIEAARFEIAQTLARMDEAGEISM